MQVGTNTAELGSLGISMFIVLPPHALEVCKIYLFLHPSGHLRLACVARLKSELFCSLYQRDSNRFAGVGTDV
jgi:hypothetical protein